MKKEKHIIQFLPYSKPHIGGVENVGEGIFGKWTYGKSSLFSGCQQQKGDVYLENKEDKDVRKKNPQKIIFPDFEIVDNFPIPKIWTRLFWKQWKKVKESIKVIGEEQQIFVITHTRFFLSSLMGGIFARRNKLKWIHIEHGSDYVKLSSPLKTKLAYIYDRCIGKWVLEKADGVLCISEASKNFVESEFGVESVGVWNRGIDIASVESKSVNSAIEIVFIGRLVTLKGVETLINAYKDWDGDLSLKIIGDGEQREELVRLSEGHDIEFLGMKNEGFIQEYLHNHKCIVVNPSYQEGMPTTVIEGLITRNVVVATDVGGTKEISDCEDLILTRASDIDDLKEKMKFAEENYSRISGLSYTHVTEKFSWESSLEKLYNLL